MSKWLAAFRTASPENLTELTDLTETACIPEKEPQSTPISVSTPVQLGQKVSVRLVGAPAPPATITTVTDKLGATWGAETAAYIRWFRSATPPAERFELQSGVVIADPARWWASIATDIEGGPRRSRGLTGALTGDLAKLYSLFGQASGETDENDDIESAAIMEFDGQETAPE